MRVPSAAIVRYGLGIVFLILGIMQWVDPTYWYGYVPPFAANLMDINTLILLNGTLDVLIGALLLVGVFTRIVAIVAALHLAGITFTMGWNDVMVRDLGLTIIAVAIATNGPDEFCLRKSSSWG